MIIIKNSNEIDTMRKAGRIAAAALKTAGEAVAPGITTAHIDKVIREVIASYDAQPSFLNLYGFPAAACISVNEQVIHGIPGPRTLKTGDIVSIDVGAFVDGFHSDTAATFAVGEISQDARQLIEVTRQSFYQGLNAACAGNRVSDISAAIEQYAMANGFNPVEAFSGHGVGRSLHEDPEVPNYVTRGRRGTRLIPGMTLAIEPMINAGCRDVIKQDDGWTVLTADRRLSAHYEHTVLITDGQPEILTVLD